MTWDGGHFPPGRYESDAAADGKHYRGLAASTLANAMLNEFFGS